MSNPLHGWTESNQIIKNMEELNAEWEWENEIEPHIVIDPNPYRTRIAVQTVEYTQFWILTIAPSPYLAPSLGKVTLFALASVRISSVILNQIQIL
jgi:hypothetical protein